MPRLKYILCLFVHQNRTNRKSAALTLDKFHHDTTDRCINRIGQLLLAIDRHIPKDLCKREKVLVERVLPSSSQCSDGSAVERVLQRDNLITALPLFSLPYFLASLIAPSLASAPELPKKTLEYPVIWHRRSASSASDSV